MLQHRKWNHGTISLAVLPKEKQDEGNCGADQEANDHGAVPSELVATVLEAEEEHDDSRADEHEAGKVEALDRSSKDFSGRRLGFWLGDAEKKEQNADDAADGEVNVEA
jgi:hypothetical protein